MKTLQECKDEVQFNKPPVYGQWIDVKSLEPESPDMVNIILEDGFRSVGRKYSNGWGVFFMDGEDLIKPDSGKRQVTHWMPLPPSPGSVDVGEKQDPAFLLAVKKKMPLSERLNTVSEKLKSVKEVSREGDIDLWNEVIQFTGTYDGSTHTYFKMIDALKERFTITRKP